MINRLLDAVLRTSAGDGPVPRAWAEAYARRAWEQGADERLVERLERAAGGLRGKRVLDLGGGPGVYSVAFARRGAQVVWHDVSRVYLELAGAKARAAGQSLGFSLGYLEDAARLGSRSFDLVFNRVCWNYAREDRPFARMIVGLLRPGGVGYVDTHNDRRSRDLDDRPWYHAVYRAAGVKLGHPFPPTGLVERLLRRAGARVLEADYSEPHNDRLLFEAGAEEAR